MLYLICRADQVPEEFDKKSPVEFKPSLDYYPRIVSANNPMEAVLTAFHPEEYRPAGRRELLAIELGEIYYLVAEPQPKYVVTEKSVAKRKRKLRPF